MMEKWKVIEYYRDIARREGVKKPTGRVKIALIYPNVYEIASQNLGFQFVYKLFNETDGIACERFVLDFYEDNLSIENQRFLREFDIIAVSINFEEDVLNLVKFLHSQKIPILSRDRGSDYPPIIAGGALTVINPQILIDIVDIILCGDFRPIYESTKSIFTDYQDKNRFIDVLKQFNFSVYSGQNRLAKPAIDYSCEPIFSTIKSCKGDFSDLFLVEASRGCRFSCRFCTTGYNLRPYRKVDIDKIKEIIENESFSDNIGIISAAFGDIDGLDNLLSWMIQKRLKISVSSLRIDSLKKEMLEKLKLLGVRSITIAEEVVSEKLKKLIKKNITEHQIYDVVEKVAEAGIENLKLYYIFCLPGEGVDDVSSMVKRIKNIGEIFRAVQRDRHNRLGKIKVSINVFNPKPFTPMQYFPLVREDEYNEKLKILSELKKIPNLKFDIMPYKDAVIQSILAKAQKNIYELYICYINNDFNLKKALKNFDYSYIYLSHDKYPWEDLVEPIFPIENIKMEYERCLQLIKN
ncbi:radical SAM protein [Calditerrivibrio nitroreducens]|nr:radical SAM protein [Calditerrivibrio nitroreducens]